MGKRWSSIAPSNLDQLKVVSRAGPTVLCGPVPQASEHHIWASEHHVMARAPIGRMGSCDAPLALQGASARRRCARFLWHSRPQYEVLVPTRLPCLRSMEGDRAASLQDAARSVCYFVCSLLLSRILVKSLTASSPWPGARCAYRIVMASDAWPSRLLTTMSGVPDWTSQLANVCLSE